MKISKNFKTINSVLLEVLKSQVKNQKKDTFVFNHLNQDFWKLKKFLGNKTDCYILTLVSLFRFKGSRKVCYSANSTIAKFIGCTPRTVQRCIRQLEHDGLVSVYNPYKEGKCYRTNAYLLSNVFNLKKVKRQLFSVVKSSLSEYVTLLKEQALYIFRNKILNLNKDVFVKGDPKANVKGDPEAIQKEICMLKAMWEKFIRKE